MSTPHHSRRRREYADPHKTNVSHRSKSSTAAESHDTILAIATSAIDPQALRERRTNLKHDGILSSSEGQSDTSSGEDDDGDDANYEEEESATPSMKNKKQKEIQKTPRAKHSQRSLEEGTRRPRLRSSKVQRRLLFEDDEKTSWTALILMCFVFIVIVGTILLLGYMHNVDQHEHHLKDSLDVHPSTLFTEWYVSLCV